jgi:hypothetical protein
VNKTMGFLANRNAVVIEFTGEHKPIVIGPFKYFTTAYDWRDEFIVYMEEEYEIIDGTEYSISVVSCISTNTSIDAVGYMVANQ